MPTNIDIQIERWPIERLKPYTGNARTHTAAQIRQISNSMTEFGWTNPILVDGATESSRGTRDLWLHKNSG